MMIGDRSPKTLWESPTSLPRHPPWSCHEATRHWTQDSAVSSHLLTQPHVSFKYARTHNKLDFQYAGLPAGWRIGFGWRAGQNLFFPPVCGSYGVSSAEGTAFQWSKREADSHCHLLRRSRMYGALTPFSHTSSCRSAYSKRKSNRTSAVK